MSAFSTSRYGKMLYNALGARRLTVATMGESHGLTDRLGFAINYACWRHYHADITFDHRPFANGGQCFAIGATTTTGLNGLTTQATWFATRPADIVFIASGYNDQPSSSTAPTIAGTVQSVANSCFAAGALMVVICGIVPVQGGTDPAGSEAYNTLMQNWCRNTPGAAFLDVTSVVANLAATSGAMGFRTATANAQGTYTVDGTHLTSTPLRALAPRIADIFRSIAPERKPRANLSAGAYDPANKPWVNILGDAGNCLGTSGLGNAGADTGVAGTSSASRIAITTGGSLVSTNSIVTGTDGERKQRMTLSGVANDLILTITPTITNVNNSDAARLYDFECMVDLNAVTGLANVSIRPFSTDNNSPAQNTDAAGLWPDATSEQLFVYSLFPFAMSGNNPAFLAIFGFSTKTPSGSIDVSRLSAMRVV